MPQRIVSLHEIVIRVPRATLDELTAKFHRLSGAQVGIATIRTMLHAQAIASRCRHGESVAIQVNRHHAPS